MVRRNTTITHRRSSLDFTVVKFLALILAGVALAVASFFLGNELEGEGFPFGLFTALGIIVGIMMCVVGSMALDDSLG